MEAVDLKRACKEFRRIAGMLLLLLLLQAVPQWSAASALEPVLRDENIDDPPVSEWLQETEGGLPTIDEILQRYVEALGGRRAIENILTRVLTGTLTQEHGDRNQEKSILPAEVTAAASDRWKLVLKTAGGAQQMGYDGKNGWIQDTENVRKDGKMARSRLAFLFHPHGPVHFRDYFSPLDLQMKIGSRGQGEYWIKTRDSAGKEQSLVFDVQTGLLTRLGEDIEVKDYRRDAGVLHPVEIVITRNGLISTYLFPTIMVNPRVKDSCFAAPLMERFFTRLLPVDDMRRDFQQLRRTLEKEHCCLYEYTSKEEFDRLFSECLNRINRPMRLNELFRLLAPLTARVGCMHTALWMPAAFFNSNPEHLFPLKVRFIENNLVVCGSYRNREDVPVGSIILAINNVPVEKIVKELRAITSADARNRYFIDTQVAKRFSMFYASVFGFPDQYLVTCQLPGEKTRLTAMVPPGDIESVRKAVFANFDHPPLTLEFLDEPRAAVMTVKTFSYYDRVDYFREFMDTGFHKIKEKGIKNLILDLRGNDGGDPFCAVILFSYLLKGPAPYFAEPYGKYSKLAEPISLPDDRFSGNLYTILDGRCGSTNGHFCALLKYHRIGTFVGTPSGSTYLCNAGKDTEIKLEKTSLILTLGRSSFAAAVKGMDKSKPILPDVRVRETYQDFLAGRDMFMEAALNLIKKKK